MLGNLERLEIIESMENFVTKIRPDEQIRPKLDYGYRIKGQSVIIFEIRPAFHNPFMKNEIEFAKATYVKSGQKWKIYWMRSNLKWYLYDPKPKVASLKEFLKIVEEDKFGAFFG